MRSLLSLMPHRPATTPRPRHTATRRSSRKWTPTFCSSELEGRVLMTGSLELAGVPTTTTALLSVPPSSLTATSVVIGSTSTLSAIAPTPVAIGSTPIVSLPTTPLTFSPTPTTPPSVIPSNVQSALNTIDSDFGLSVVLPTHGVQFSTFTTANEPAAISSLGLPLRGGVTYYDAIISSGFSASFGNISAGNSGAASLAVVVDPADPCVYVSAGVDTTFQYGISAHGLIPFVPSASNYSGPAFSGQLWGSVQGLPVGDLPVSVSGDVTINLDGNSIDNPLTIGQNAYQLFQSGGLSTSVLPQIDLGVNGTLSYTPAIEDVSLSLPIYNVSFAYIAGQSTFLLEKTYTGEDVYSNGDEQLATSTQVVSNLGPTVSSGYQVPAPVTTTYGPFYSEGAGQRFYIEWTTSYSIVPSTNPTSISFAGTTVNPLEGTKLSSLFSNDSFAIEYSTSGYTPSDFLNNFSASLQTQGGLSIDGYSFSAGEIDLQINSGGASLNASEDILGTSVDLTGAVNFANGGFELGASLSTSELPFDASLNVAFYYDYAGYSNGLYVSINASLDENFTYTDDFGDEYGFDVDLDLSGTLHIGTNGSFDANLDVTASATIYLGILGSYGASIGADANISNNSLSLSFNDGVGDTPSITINY